MTRRLLWLGALWALVAIAWLCGACQTTPLPEVIVFPYPVTVECFQHNVSKLDTLVTQPFDTGRWPWKSFELCIVRALP